MWFVSYTDKEIDLDIIPNDEEQKKFIKQYLQEKARINGENLESITDEDVETLFFKSQNAALVRKYFFLKPGGGGGGWETGLKNGHKVMSNKSLSCH